MLVVDKNRDEDVPYLFIYFFLAMESQFHLLYDTKGEENIHFISIWSPPPTFKEVSFVHLY